ncbi:transthyretin-like protein 2 precursor [Aphelenchoides avenae]|nr:transthyretin-like protein 2 precursor [Aphelenchus avenae]
MQSFTILALAVCALFATAFASEQRIRVKGQVICDKRSMRNVRVELREHDTFDPDDSLAETHTDKDGYFVVEGMEDEVRSIKPYIRIQHNCDVKDRATCARTSDFEIPEDKVSAGEYDMNFVNLNLRGHKDTETCN